jgi:hypothetical protein
MAGQRLPAGRERAVTPQRVRVVLILQTGLRQERGAVRATFAAPAQGKTEQFFRTVAFSAASPFQAGRRNFFGQVYNRIDSALQCFM